MALPANRFAAIIGEPAGTAAEARSEGFHRAFVVSRGPQTFRQIFKSRKSRQGSTAAIKAMEDDPTGLTRVSERLFPSRRADCLVSDLPLRFLADMERKRGSLFRFGPHALPQIGNVSMVPEADLIEAACELLEEAAQAWSCYATGRALFAYQHPNGPVSPEQFQELQVRLAASYGSAVSAFSASDRALRAELARKGEAPEAASPETVAAILGAASMLQLSDAAVGTLSLHIAGVARVDEVDSHGAEWLLRFLTSFGRPGEVAVHKGIMAH